MSSPSLFPDDLSFVYSERLRNLLSDGALDPKAVDCNGSTALMRAATIGDAECVKALLPLSDLNAADARGSTPLILAAAQGHPECVNLLTPAIDASAVEESGANALMAAANNGHAECVNLLLPASDSEATDKSGWTALMHAALRGHVECLELLLPASDARVADHFGKTALMHAASGGSAECVRALLPRSDANATSASRWTALRFAAVADHLDCVKTLLSHLDANAALTAPNEIANAARAILDRDFVGLVDLEGLDVLLASLPPATADHSELQSAALERFGGPRRDLLPATSRVVERQALQEVLETAARRSACQAPPDSVERRPTSESASRRGTARGRGLRL